MSMGGTAAQPISSRPCIVAMRKLASRHSNFLDLCLFRQCNEKLLRLNRRAVAIFLFTVFRPTSQPRNCSLRRQTSTRSI
jgi:hypothetical protein